MKVGIWSACQKHSKMAGGEDTYSSDANFLSDVTRFVNIDFVELDGREPIGEFFEERADNSAWTTPSCPEVEDGNLVLVYLMVHQPKNG